MVLGAVGTGTTVGSIFVGTKVVRTCGEVGRRIDVGETVTLMRDSAEGCSVSAIGGIVVGGFVVKSIGVTVSRREGGNVVGFAEGLVFGGIAVGVIEGITVG